MIKDVEIRIATEDDIRVFYPQGSSYEVRAWVALYKGDVKCLAGVLIEADCVVPFCDVLANDAPKLTVWRTAKELFRLIKGLGQPLLTGTQGRKSRFLETLGFRHIGNNEGWEMYIYPAGGNNA